MLLCSASVRVGPGAVMPRIGRFVLERVDWRRGTDYFTPSLSRSQRPMAWISASTSGTLPPAMTNEG